MNFFSSSKKQRRLAISEADILRWANSKLQLVQDQPAGQPLMVASIDVPGTFVTANSVSDAYRAHPPPDVPLLLRTLRLAL